MNSSFSIQANLVDLFNKTISSKTILIENGKIKSIQSIADNKLLPYALPGFIDAHVHIESSMLLPSEFAKLAVVHGTVATVSDPHEIANVCGVEGVKYMIENGKKVPFYFCFGAPSCVPATVFETAGAAIYADEIDTLLQSDDIYYLTEMMNFPGVLFNDEEVMKKIASAKKYNKPVDGHAPGLRGNYAKKYFEAGITTDHECFTYEEGKEKAELGVKILIREGSAAKNFEALIPLIKDFPNQIMFCSDDKHPDNLVEGHINLLVKRALAKGFDLFDVLRSACILPALHYKIPVGLLRTGDAADFILVNDLKKLEVQKTFIKGNTVAENGVSKIESVQEKSINKFFSYQISKEEIKILRFAQNDGNTERSEASRIKVIKAENGQLVTEQISAAALISNHEIISNPEQDILKLVCVNRYSKAKPAVALIKNFGLKQGAIASSVAHDSHNIIAVGADDDAIVKAINLIMKNNGGVCAVNNAEEKILPLPIAGLMSTENGYDVANKYSEIDAFAKSLGSTLDAPFMTLSFMALLVIPKLKLSDMGLFDGEKFEFTNLQY
ncbi:MAG: adenine deaminase [Bacteroidota bacterium]|jgi:adenine deaminase